MNSEPFGLLLLDKPAGITSHDVVAIARRALQVRKIGHAGTLDPAATGLLILLVGRATKLSERFLGTDKSYEAVLTLGITTDTADGTGRVIDSRPVPPLTREDLEKVFSGFRGAIRQIPPMYSAKKINGKKLYNLARSGRTIERPPQDIVIAELEISAVQLPMVHFFLRCSKGTYVRTLCEDIGEAVGCGGHMQSLRRTACGEYRVESACSVAYLRTAGIQELSRRLIVPEAK